MLKIGIIDSGLGGFSVLKGLLDKGIMAEYYYLYDNKYHPYGSKTKAELNSIAYKNISTLLIYGVDMVVIACNTMTAGTIDSVRRMFSLPIIGVEPPIKPCVKECRKVAILATPFTIHSERLHSQIVRSTETDFYYPELSSLAELVENTIYIDKSISEGYLRDECRSINDCDGVVVGCTHYNFILPEIQSVFEKAKIYTSIDGVVGRVQAVMTDNGWVSEKYCSVELIPTNNTFDYVKKYFLCKYIDLGIVICEKK